MTRGRKPYERVQTWTWAIQSVKSPQRFIVGESQDAAKQLRHQMGYPEDWRIVKLDVFDRSLRAKATVTK
jgi:hypothetical protein